MDEQPDEVGEVEHWSDVYEDALRRNDVDLLERAVPRSTPTSCASASPTSSTATPSWSRGGPGRRRSARTRQITGALDRGPGARRRGRRPDVRRRRRSTSAGSRRRGCAPTTAGASAGPTCRSSRADRRRVIRAPPTADELLFIAVYSGVHTAETNAAYVRRRWGDQREGERRSDRRGEAQAPVAAPAGRPGRPGLPHPEDPAAGRRVPAQRPPRRGAAGRAARRVPHPGPRGAQAAATPRASSARTPTAATSRSSPTSP